MSKHEEQLASIDPQMLAGVSGGAAANEQVVTLLQSVMSSIKDLATATSSSSGDSFMQMMPMMMMMMSRGGATAAPVAAAPACPCAGTGGGDGWIKVT